MTDAFAATFGVPPAATGRAPARVNLLGEHTDYNDGFVLPTPLPYFTTVSVAAGDRPGMIRAWSARFRETLERPLEAQPRGDWLDYVLGCVRVLAERQIAVPGLLLAIDSAIPIGAGISSSAALEVATLRALRELLRLDLDEEAIVRLAQRAEASYVGMPCGIMDQMVSALGVPGEAMFLDIRDLFRALLPLPPSCRIAVVHCGVAHRLTTGGYRQRLAECRAAAAALGVASLRDLDLDDLPAVAALPEPLDRRARHVITENRCVLDGVDALKRGDAAGFGHLMTDSHCSQRDDYEVSIPEIDEVVAAALGNGALGARLTGGGFGGSVVALVPEDAVGPWWTAVSEDCPEAWLVYGCPARRSGGREDR